MSKTVEFISAEEVDCTNVFLVSCILKRLHVLVSVSHLAMFNVLSAVQVGPALSEKAKIIQSLCYSTCLIQNLPQNLRIFTRCSD